MYRLTTDNYIAVEWIEEEQPKDKKIIVYGGVEQIKRAKVVWKSDKIQSGSIVIVPKNDDYSFVEDGKEIHIYAIERIIAHEKEAE